MTPGAVPLLDPRTLRAGTTLRFFLLLMAVTVASTAMLDTILTPLPWHSAQTECEFAAGFDPNGNMLNELLLDQRSSQGLARCAGGHPASYPYWRGVAGTAVLIVLAAVVYWYIPIWRARRACCNAGGH